MENVRYTLVNVPIGLDFPKLLWSEVSGDARKFDGGKRGFVLFVDTWVAEERKDWR